MGFIERIRPACLAFLLIAAFPALATADVIRVADFDFFAPSGWERMETSSPMRKAQYLVPGHNSGDDGLVIFFHFGPGRGGSPAANIRRWQSQFVEPVDTLRPTIDRSRVGDRQLHLFRASGTLVGPNRQQIPNYALMAAVLESPAGNVYIRFAGPRALVDANAASFRAMVESSMRRRGTL